MKKIILVSLLSVLLSSCASYGELQVKCAQGDTQACIDKANRDNIMGGMAVGMAQEQARQQQSPEMVTTHCHTTATGATCTTF